MDYQYGGGGRDYMVEVRGKGGGLSGWERTAGSIARSFVL